MLIMYIPQNGMKCNMFKGNRGNIYSTGISRLKILNILAFSTKSHYQNTLWSAWFKEIRYLFFRIDKTQQFLKWEDYKVLLTIACSILLSMATPPPPDALEKIRIFH